MASPHEVLNINSDADEATIHEAYRRRVKEVHPDQGGSVRAFRQVQAAYEQLLSGQRQNENHLDVTAGETESEQASNRPGAWRRRTRSRRHGGDHPPGREDVQVTQVEYLDFSIIAKHGWSLDDADLFEKADTADLPPSAHGQLHNDQDESLLEAAEECGYDWPYSCRGGACANCAIAVIEGDLSMPANHVLPEELVNRGFRLSCLGRAVGDSAKIVYNVKDIPDLEELLLPARPD